MRGQRNVYFKEDIHGSPFLATIGSLFFFLSDARKREVVFLHSSAVSFYNSWANRLFKSKDR